jgi:hypothetical protein
MRIFRADVGHALAVVIGECEECGREFEARDSWRRFCCEAHRKRAEGRRRSQREVERKAAKSVEERLRRG